MLEYVVRDGKRLRKGYTTGTCAAAAAGAAAVYRETGECPASMKVRTSAGEQDIPVFRDSDSSFYVIKDAGDDPDATHGAKISAEIKVIGEVEAAKLSGVFTSEEYPFLLLAGGEGVGTVTKEGLEQPVGYPAINKVPRQQIFGLVGEFTDAEFADSGRKLLITISVRDGEKIAAHTMNGVLGIRGGISILGTGGIVEPMSTQAVVDTIRVTVHQLVVSGKKSVTAVPGNFGMRYSEQFPEIDREAVVRCSNFIGDTIDIAAAEGIEQLLLIGDIGKLVKLAAGIMNTHSHTADGRQEIFAAHAAMCGAGAQQAEELMECITTEQMLAKLEDWNLYEQVLESILRRIHVRVSRRAGEHMKCGAIIFSQTRGFLGQTETAGEILENLRGN